MREEVVDRGEPRLELAGPWRAFGAGGERRLAVDGADAKHRHDIRVM